MEKIFLYSFQLIRKTCVVYPTVGHSIAGENFLPFDRRNLKARTDFGVGVTHSVWIASGRKQPEVGGIAQKLATANIGISQKLAFLMQKEARARMRVQR